MTIEQLEALERAATAGIWCADADAVVVGEDYTVSENSRVADSELIAASRNALPALLAVAKAAKEMVADLDRWEQAVAKVVDYKFVPKWNSKEATRAALAQLEAKP